MTINVRQVPEEDFDEFAELVNEFGQLSWDLTPSKMEFKLGRTGIAFGAFDEDRERLVGTIAIKKNNELGYLVVHPDYRNSNAFIQLFRAIKRVKPSYPYLFMTVREDNRVMNRIWEVQKDVVFLGKVDSRFSTNVLNVYALQPDDVEETKKQIENELGPIE